MTKNHMSFLGGKTRRAGMTLILHFTPRNECWRTSSLAAK